MNRELFISDFKRLSRQYPPDQLPDAIADYVKTNFAPLVSYRKPIDGTVAKDIIVEKVCSFYNRPLADILNGGRFTKNIKVKHIIVYFLCKRSSLTQREIAIIFGYNDHSSVIHARDSIKDEMDINKGLRNDIEFLNNQLNQYDAQSENMAGVLQTDLVGGEEFRGQEERP